MPLNLTGPPHILSRQTWEALTTLDACSVSNAIEQFRVRTQNEGFVSMGVRCQFPELGPRAGYAIAASIRTSNTPVGGHCYYNRADWWSYVNSMPGPKFLVVQDVDHVPGVGALFGEIHACIAKTLGCVAYLTNGSVRDLPGIQTTGLQLFAGSIAVSHSYAHIVDFGEVAEIGGLRIHPGDILHGDRHGVVCIPPAFAAKVPKMAAILAEKESELINFCRSNDFTFAELLARVQHAAGVLGLNPELENLK